MIWTTAITGVCSLAAAVVSALILRKVQQVHVLVNSRLDSALAEADDLRKQQDPKASVSEPDA
jgi:predicted membrane-bound spermidine synthase